MDAADTGNILKNPKQTLKAWPCTCCYHGDGTRKGRRIDIPVSCADRAAVAWREVDGVCVGACVCEREREIDWVCQGRQQQAKCCSISVSFFSILAFLFFLQLCDFAKNIFFNTQRCTDQAFSVLTCWFQSCSLFVFYSFHSFMYLFIKCFKIQRHPKCSAGESNNTQLEK